MLQCPTCHKTLPYGDRYCAYCGAALARRLPFGLRLSLPNLYIPRRQWMMAAGGAALGGMSGGLLGLMLGAAFVGFWVGAIGLGAGAMLGEAVAGAIPDRRSAERFGLIIGGLGGLLALVGGTLIAALFSLTDGDPAGVVEFFGLLTAGLPGTLASAIVGVGAGVLAGRYFGAGGYLFGRRGAIVGAAAAWTLAGVLAGVVSGDYAGQITGADRVASATLGAVVQVLVGALLLFGLQGLVRRWRNWWARRP
jgi:hypothetical protein